jgi:hypothetical protein
MGVQGFGLKGQPGELMTAAYDDQGAGTVAFDMTTAKPPTVGPDGHTVAMTVSIAKLRDFHLQTGAILAAADARAERDAAAAQAEAEQALTVDMAPAKKSRKKS